MVSPTLKDSHENETLKIEKEERVKREEEKKKSADSIWFTSGLSSWLSNLEDKKQRNSNH